MITIGQIKAARMMLNMKQTELAKKAGVSIATLNNIERGAQKDPKISTMKSIIQALEREGIEFTQDALGSVGVSLKPARNTGNAATVLIIDDNNADRMLYRKWLGKAPGRKYHVIEAGNAREGFDAFIEHQPHCVILDFMMYGTDGFQLLAEFRRVHLKLPPIVFITGMHNETMESNAKAQGVHAYLNKQAMRPDDLCAAVASACRNFLS